MDEIEQLKIKGVGINNLLHGLPEDRVIIEDWTSEDYDAVFKKKLEIKERINELEEEIIFLKNDSEKIDKIMTLRFQYKK
jgi:hypothetical protein